MVFVELFTKIIYLLSITVKPIVFWEVLPLAIATVIIISYFQLYKDEKPGWNTYLSNSLILIFISISLIRFLYTMDSDGLANFTDFPAKTIAIILLIGIGIYLTRFNFEHLLPEKYAIHLSSPLTINLVAYAIILFVHSRIAFSWLTVLALLIIIVGLSLAFQLIKIPIRKFFKFFEKERRKERLENIKEAKMEIDELKKDLKYRRKQLKKQQLKRAEQEKREAIKIKKLLRGEKIISRSKNKKRKR